MAGLALTRSPDITEALFTLFVHAPYGETFTYESLGEVMGRNARQSSGRHYILAAGKRLEREGQRALRCVPRVGYQIARPEEHLGLGEGRQRRGRRQINAAMRVLQATPRDELSPEHRKRHEAFITILQQQADALRHVQAKAKKAYAEIDAAIEAKLQEDFARIRALQG